VFDTSSDSIGAELSGIKLMAFDTSSDSRGAELSGIKLMAFDYLDRVDQLKDGRDSDFRFGVGPFADRSIS
jgi:hypothetical protein